MTDPLHAALARKPFLLADGAAATNLFARGLEAGAAPELWNIDKPAEIRDLHRSFVDAGCDLVLTNSFGANRYRLKLHQAEERVEQLNGAAAELARSVVDKDGDGVLVAGSIGPTGELMTPLGPLGEDDATASFAEQAKALAAGGVDLLWIETMSAPEELKAAAAGAASTGLPYICTMTFDTAGRTMMGLAPEDFARLCATLLPTPAAYGANCGVGAPELLHSLLGLRAGVLPGDILVAKGNCGVPTYVDGALAYGGTPSVMAEYARMARDCGARIIGGCCGTTPAHLQAMRAALDAHEPGPPPDIGRIAAAIGTPWRNVDKSSARRPRNRRRA